MFGIKISFHSNTRINTRFAGLLTEDEVTRAISSKADRISPNYPEAKVVVKSFGRKVFANDGSNGQHAVACVDTRTGTVKTVMLRRTGQLDRDSDAIW